MISGELLQSLTDTHRDRAADAGVDFVEDQRGGNGLLFHFVQTGLQRQGNAGKFAAGGRLLQGLGHFA